MSLLRVPIIGLASGELTLPEESGRYIVKVHRKSVGDQLLLFDPHRGVQAQAAIVSDRLPEVQVLVSDVVVAPEHNMPVTLWVALAKADKPEQAVRDATAYGARRVVFVHAERSVVKAKGEQRNDRLLRVAEQVARQCGRGDLPELVGPLSLQDALAQELGAEQVGQPRLICAFSPQSRPLLELLQSEVARTTLSAQRADSCLHIMIGPEGGFSPAELEATQTAGFVPVDLGPYVLRAEVACGAVLATLRAHWQTLRP